MNQLVRSSVQPLNESDGVAPVLAQEIVSLVNDRERLTQLGLNAVRTGKERSQAGTGRAFAEAWSKIVAESPVRV